LILLTAFGCNRPDETEPVQSESIRQVEPKVADAPETAVDLRDWSKQVGETVRLTGKAINHKICATLYVENSMIYVDLDSTTHWPDGLYHGGEDGELVQVTGTVAHRSMLPVFVQHPDDPPKQGMPVLEGTDLNEAAKAYVLEDVSWQRITPKSN